MSSGPQLQECGSKVSAPVENAQRSTFSALAGPAREIMVAIATAAVAARNLHITQHPYARLRAVFSGLDVVESCSNELRAKP